MHHLHDHPIMDVDSSTKACKNWEDVDSFGMTLDTPNY